VNIKPLAETRFTFLDIETTGLSFVKGEDIIELACIKTLGLKVESSWSQLIDAYRAGKPVAIKEAAYLVHGITAIDLAGKPKFEQVYPRLVEELKNSDFVVIHNSPFDAGFIVPKIKSLALPVPATPTLCSLKLARALYPGERCGLEPLRERFGETAEGAHRALADTLALYAVFFKMLFSYFGEGVTVADVLRKHGPTTPFLNFSPR